MNEEYTKTTVASLIVVAGLLLLDLIAPGVASFGLAALLAAVVIPAVIAPEAA
ncbi:hypothetical protein [Streptomyces katrae]|uniref:hypothetical protein n=1 Tax=Streptomyces katrae TaxID=68223 RepID=UPI000AE37C9B|nr:hypothetical protein [Streptomyces katrae]